MGQNISELKEQCWEWLKGKWPDAVEKYESADFAFISDFYIPSIDLYIMCRFGEEHGNHAYRQMPEEDKAVLKELKRLGKTKEADIWSKCDPIVRSEAKKSMINFVEFFDINEAYFFITCYDDGCTWGLSASEIFDICKFSDFPGNSKWPADNPIWESFLPNCKSPKEAWKDEDCINRAIENMMWILNHSVAVAPKYDEFVWAYRHAFYEALKGNMQEILEKVLTRFTVAKIAPKVTALSASKVLKIIEESGIDISSGVYCPMAGFGGIIKASQDWFTKRGLSYEGKIESYDINKNFVDYYHFDGVRDILAQTITTDKTVIACPPFGKDYEHWSGTPNEMADKSFLEWFRLIKEHVKAPKYIILGPELNSNSKHLDTQGKKYNPLFKRRIGAQLWTDEMYEEMKGKEPKELLEEGIKL